MAFYLNKHDHLMFLTDYCLETDTSVFDLVALVKYGKEGVALDL